MPTTVEVPGLGRIAFPDSMSVDEIHDVLNDKSGLGEEKPAATPTASKPPRDRTAEKKELQRQMVQTRIEGEQGKATEALLGGTEKTASLAAKLTEPLSHFPGREAIKSVLQAPFQIASDISEGNESAPIADKIVGATPPDRAFDVASGALAGVGKAGEFFMSPVGIATLGMGYLPALAQRAIALGFAGQMASSLPGIKKALEEELSKPENERDWGKISELTTDAATTLGFTTAAGFHGLTGKPLFRGKSPEADAALKNAAKSGAPLTATATADALEGKATGTGTAQPGASPTPVSEAAAAQPKPAKSTEDKLAEVNATLDALEKLHGPRDVAESGKAGEPPKMKPYRALTAREQTLLGERDKLEAEIEAAKSKASAEPQPDLLSGNETKTKSAEGETKASKPETKPAATETPQATEDLAQDNRPAIKTVPDDQGNQQTIPAERKEDGQWESHDEIAEAAGLSPADVADKVFLDKDGKEKSRPEAAKDLAAAGVQTGSPGAAHSTDVNAAVAPETAEPMPKVEKSGPMDPEAERHLENARSTVPEPVDVLDELPSGEPFASGEIATIDRKRKRILLNRKEFESWLADRHPDDRALAVRSLLNHEHIHLAVPDAEASKYWGLMWKVEQAINRRRYTGKWRAQSGEDAVNMGHEALRFRLQQLSDMTPQEIAEAHGWNELGMQGLTALESVVRKIRETLKPDTKSETAGILDRMMDNLKVAEAVATGTPPSAFNKGRLEDEVSQKRSQMIFSRHNDGSAHQVMEDLDKQGTILDPGVSKMAKALLLLGDRGTTFKWLNAEQEEAFRAEFNDRYPKDHWRGKGTYLPVENTIVIPKSLVDYYEKMGRGLPEVMVHEYAHAMTGRRVLSEDSPHMPELVAMWDQARDAYEQKYGEGAPEGDTLTMEQRANLDNAMQSPNEFLAQAFSDSHTQDFLRQFEVEGTPAGYWSKFVDWVGRVLGIEDKTALDRVIRVGMEIGTDRGPTDYSRGPSAINKRARKQQSEESSAQDRMFLPPPPQGTTPERGAPTMPAGPTALDLDKAGYAHLQQQTDALDAAAKAPGAKLDAKALSFDNYVDALRGKSELIKPGQAYESYERNLYKRLFNASGDSLKAIAKSLDLVSAFNVADPRPNQGPLLESEFEDKAMAKDARERTEALQRSRNGLIGRIAQSLLKDAAKGFETRKTAVGVDDLLLTGESKEAGFWDVSKDDLKDPKLLGKRLTQDARRSQNDPVSLTKRLTVLVPKGGGPAFAVSTYATRGETMLLDPSVSALRAHRPLKEILQNYRPVASMLLDEPVQNFRQKFDSLAEFESTMGEQARAAVEPPSPFEGQVEKTPLTGQEAAQMGMEEEPQASPESQVAAETKTRRPPLTEAEAGSVLDTLYDEVQKLDSPEDTRHLIEGLHDRAQAQQKFEEQWRQSNPETREAMADQPKPLSPRDRQAISALEKIFTSVRRKWPQLTEQQAYDQTLDEIYDLANKSQSREEFTAQALSRYAPQVRGIDALRQDIAAGKLGQARVERPESSAEELTMRERRAPTSVSGQETPKGPGPEPRPGPQAPPEKLPTEALDAMEKALDEIYGKGEPYPVSPDYPITKGYGKPKGKPVGEYFGPFESADAPMTVRQRQLARETAKKAGRSPSAINKKVKEASEKLGEAFEELAVVRATQAGYKRKDVKAAIPRLLDGSDGVTALMTNQAGQRIRERSLRDLPPEHDKKTWNEKRKAVNAEKAEAKRRREAGLAYVASGEIDPQGAWSANIDRLTKTIPAKGSKPAKLSLEALLDQAQARASAWAKDFNPLKRVEGREDMKMIKKMRDGIEYAKAHWYEPEFRRAAEQYRKEMSDHILWQNANGFNIRERENYVPGRYESSYWSDDGIKMFSNRLLGTNYRLEKKFPTPYEAIADGPYRMRSLDLADLAEHRIAQGTRQVQRNLWFKSLNRIDDPVSGEPVAINPEMHVKEADPNDPLSKPEAYYTVPEGKADYVLVDTGKSRPLAIRRGYEDLIKTLVAPSAIETHLGEVTHDLLRTNQMLKHGAILLLDTFHPGRMNQLAASIFGKDIKDIGYNAGFSALEYDPATLKNMVKKGYVSKAAAEWADGSIELRPGNSITRRQMLNMLVSDYGFNVARLTDSLYRDAIQSVPIIGDKYHKLISPYNEWLFRKMIPGLMNESAVKAVEKALKANPGVERSKLLADTVKDLNIRFGTMGRQGVFKGKTMQQLSQLVFLAPSWREGLIQSEIRFAARSAGLAGRGAVAAGRAMGLNVPDLPYRKGLPMMGTLGSSMARGLATYLVATQVINLITTGHSTLENEEGHKLDAWLSLGGEGGVWLSPMAVFAEVTHDIIRMRETKPRVYDIVSTLGENALGPVGKMLAILARGESPQHEYYSTTPGLLAGAASEVTPLAGASPISFSVPGREIGHALMPNTVAPNRPGALQRQILASTAGIKTELPKTPTQQVMALAREFAQKNNLKPETGWREQQTDEPSYTKLRAALRNDDVRGTKSMFEDLVKGGHSPVSILKAMRNNARRPFTGSAAGDNKFFASLDDRQRDLLNQAKQDRMQELQKFEKFLAEYLATQ